MYDVLIIGGGVIGASIARELSKYKLSLALVEKRADLAMGASKANSGIVHAGYDAVPGTLKAKTNLAGNAMFDKLSRELDFPFRRIGSLVLAFREEDIPKLEELRDRGGKNGVPGLQVLTKKQVHSMEPNVSDQVSGALFAPTGGIVCPYEMTFALAENAADNGCDFYLEEKVTAIEKKDGFFSILTENRHFEAKVVINAAGVFADTIHQMVSDTPLTIVARAGEYVVFDRTVGDTVSHTLFQLPTDMGKGVLVTPSVDGNLLIGPTATDLTDKTNRATTHMGREQVLSSATLTLKTIPTRDIIHGFTGLRAHPTQKGHDFIIQHIPDALGVIDVAGIESPGLTAAPAIGEMVADLVGELLPLLRKENFNPYRNGVPRFRELSYADQQEIIAENPLYGHIVCRCETVTEGEIVDSIQRPVGARNLDAVKRRVRAGMGRCQGGFCSPQVLEILARELSLDPTEVTLFGGESQILIGKNREIGGFPHED